MRPGAPTSRNRFVWRLSPFDLIWAVIAPFIALGLRDPGLLDLDAGNKLLPASYEFAICTVVFAIPSFLFYRLSCGIGHFFSTRDLYAVLAATLTIVAGTSVTLFVVNRLDGVPRSTPVIYGLVLAGGLFAGRVIARLGRMERWFEIEENAEPQLRRVVLVGIDHFAATVIKLTDCQQPRTTQIVTLLDRREALAGRTVNGVKVVGRPADLEAVIEEYQVHGVEIDEVWLSDNTMTRGEMSLIEHQCRALGVKACAVSHALNLAPRQAPMVRAARPEPQIVAPHSLYFRFKRGLDVLVATILLVFLAPVASIIACVTYFNVGGPVIFWQRRIGQNGGEFFLFKFRTYQAPYSKNGERVHHAARLSKIGEVVRATRLDEIPQLFNILRGDMSLIGPRPLLPKDQPTDPSLRLAVRPGVTGWAQVMGGTLVTAEEKDALDVWYIHHASPALDLKIILRTLKIVFRGINIQREAIDAAVNWRKKIRQIDHRLFDEGSLAGAELRSEGFRRASISL